MASERIPKIRGRLTAGTCLWLSLGLVFGGCATMEHGRGAKALANQTLSTASSPGQEQLRNEIEYDSAISSLISRHGRPDYLHVVSRDKIYLFFIEQDSVAMVQRALIPPGEIKLFKRTPGFLLTLLPEEAANAILAQREGQKKTARRSKPKTSSARTHRPPPAARAPVRSTNISNFDSRSIVIRLREPLSAADPGVSDWSWGRRPDGSVAQIADDGTTRYLIGPNSVIVGTRIAASRRSPPEAIRRGVYRLNQAIFGTRATAADLQVRSMVAKVAADPSGRTRLTQRVAGRKVLISRDPRNGFLSYTIFPH